MLLHVNRCKEAEQALLECLSVRRRLVKDDDYADVSKALVDAMVKHYQRGTVRGGLFGAHV